MALVVLLAARRVGEGYAVLYGLLFGWLLLRLAASWLWRPRQVSLADEDAWLRVCKVAAVVPAYNEDPEAVIRTIRSLYVGTRQPDTAYIVDDGSTSRDGMSDLLYRAASSSMDVRVLPMAKNQGKRFAQAEAWNSTRPGEYHLWLIIDSDTTVAKHAVERMVRAFADEDVDAATSLILPRNRGLLPALQEIEYATSQLSDRLMWSVCRTVPVISGGYCAVRDSVIRENLATYLAGYWGANSYGDDRHMAILANSTGRVIVVPDARSYTNVPTGMRQLWKQRLRWQRGAYLGMAWTVTHVSWRRRIWWVVAANLTLMLGAWAILAYAVTAQTVRGLPTVALWVAVLCWIRSLRYLAVPHPCRSWQFFVWLLAPVQRVLSMWFYVPIQMWALVTCKRQTWGTR